MIAYIPGNRSIPKIFDQFICSSLAVPRTYLAHYSSNSEKFVKIYTTSCLLTILTNQNAHEYNDWSINIISRN